MECRGEFLAIPGKGGVTAAQKSGRSVELQFAQDDEVTPQIDICRRGLSNAAA